jgi:2-keto-4-pentenoate hydratase/2-oxohepta-3-ene-1,7-dioic acid hydratase in catechol pathway
MPFSIVRYKMDGEARWGRLVSAAPTRPDDQVTVEPLASSAPTTAALLAEYDATDDLPGSGATVSLAARDITSPVTADATLICQGLNYSDHAAESGHGARKANLLFSKASSSLTGPYDDIIRPNGVELLDYEAEIGIVLRKAVTAGTLVGEADVGDYVGAVVLCNDVSARDVMFGASFLQWFQGKSYRTFCPTGPVLYLLKPEETASVLGNLAFTLDYRGSTRQSANSANQIHKAPETLTQIAALLDLKPGDLVLTGTPGGVLSQGSPTLARIMTTNLFDDATRRAELVAASKQANTFLQPGDTLALRLRDEANGLDLGGQFSRIA